MSIFHLDGRRVETDTLIKFLENHERLQRFHLIASTESDETLFYERLNREWMKRSFIKAKNNFACQK